MGNGQPKYYNQLEAVDITPPTTSTSTVPLNDYRNTSDSSEEEPVSRNRKPYTKNPNCPGWHNHTPRTDQTTSAPPSDSEHTANLAQGATQTADLVVQEHIIDSDHTLPSDNKETSYNQEEIPVKRKRKAYTKKPNCPRWNASRLSRKSSPLDSDTELSANLAVDSIDAYSVEAIRKVITEHD